MEKYPIKKFDPDWIIQEGKLDMLFVKWAESFGEFLAKKPKKHDKNGLKDLSTSQLRKFFGELKKIQADYENQRDKVPLLIPKLAYAVGRDYNSYSKRAKSKVQEFYEEISKGIEVATSKERYDRLVNAVESIVAYHKLHGGTTN